MKQLLFLALILFCYTLTAQNNDKYLKNMLKNIASLDTAKQSSSFTQISNKFERIADAEKKQWLPYYYAAYCQLMALFSQRQTITAATFANNAQKYISIADSLSPQNHEIITLNALLCSARIMENPATNGMKYGMQQASLLAKAKQLNPENPRTYLLDGQSKYYTPAQWGGGKALALPLLEQAAQKFKTFIPESDISPKWGEKLTQKLIEACKKP